MAMETKASPVLEVLERSGLHAASGFDESEDQSRYVLYSHAMAGGTRPAPTAAVADTKTMITPSTPLSARRP